MDRYISRFKNAIATNPRIVELIEDLHDKFMAWQGALPQSAALTPSDEIWRNRVHSFISEKGIQRLMKMIGRTTVTERAPQARRALNTTAALVDNLRLTYVGPGVERPGGPRHDNDHVDIHDIKIAPTEDELNCVDPPYLPYNVCGAPHSYPPNSMQRLLDIHFRLLREELIAELRTAIQLIVADIRAPKKANTPLKTIVDKQGGYYKTIENNQSVMFPVYTNFSFTPLTLSRRGISCGVEVDAPPFGGARAQKASDRIAYWQAASRKKLAQGSLVALVWSTTPADTKIYIGIITSTVDELVNSCKSGSSRVTIKVSFIDPSAELRILEDLKRRGPSRGENEGRFLTECPIMYESIRPFLQALLVEPSVVPFERYLAHPEAGSLKGVKVEPPLYSTLPGFQFELASLLRPESGIRSLKLDVMDPNSRAAVLTTLTSPLPSDPSMLSSILDPSQADAILSALTSEVSLMQGPPGTGKSYSGVQLLRVLVQNKIGPILVMAFTNHAVDHLIRVVLDSKITSRVVRLGSRSADEDIAARSLEALEKLQAQSRLRPKINKQFGIIKDLEKDMSALMNRVAGNWVPSEKIVNMLEFDYPDQYESLIYPPAWIIPLFKSAQVNDDWETVGGDAHTIKTLFDYWYRAYDVAFINQPSLSEETPSASANQFSILANESESNAALQGEESDGEGSTHLQSEDESEDDNNGSEPPWKAQLEQDARQKRINRPVASNDAQPTLFVMEEPEPTPRLPLAMSPRDMHFAEFGVNPTAPPNTNRPLEELELILDVWSLSPHERTILGRSWIQHTRLRALELERKDFERLREQHKEAQDRYNNLVDESRIEILRNADIVACTTNGAAKLSSMLKAFGPRVMIAEEAGQILEAHILASLVPSVQHLILIGDPQQLRPTISTYSLSMDNARGKLLYRLDLSLMERLADLGLTMSQLTIQRRMRPEISTLIRPKSGTLYPRLEDHSIVKAYPAIRGLQRDVYFVNHSGKENGADEDSVSKHNKFEAAMIKDLVLHLLRQGIYNEEGDIVVLCAYLGQLAEIRKQLAAEVVTILDDRDMLKLASAEEANEGEEGPRMPLMSTTVERVKVSQRVLLRTVDNFQGEEAKIVILSLVRNSGTLEPDGTAAPARTIKAGGGIGFLKSENRANVALSRAKHGMYIFGDTGLLSSRSPMWSAVIDELDASGRVGLGIPISCAQHPQDVRFVRLPGELRNYAPDGGCLRPCEAKLNCGHMCAYKCHSDDPQHLAIVCNKPCARLCPLGHPCNRECGQPCGECQFPAYAVTIPECGHVVEQSTCHRARHPGQIECSEMVEYKLPRCEHKTVARCGSDLLSLRCMEPCMEPTTCGRSHTCKARCHECQALNPQGSTDRTIHQDHLCGRDLLCGHACREKCSPSHQCSGTCKSPCRQSCSHHMCRRGCSVPCAPCIDACTWNCTHQKCPLPCGSICSRLPCDERCPSTLTCGHQCPSVCGEPCQQQVCPECANDAQLAQVVDHILFQTLEEVRRGNEDVRLITLKCGHTFTTESLDGLCGLGDHYTKDLASDAWLEAIDFHPPNGLTPFPRCPNCRADVTSPRYNRVLKRAKLDLMENGVASQLAHSLATSRQLVASFPVDNIRQALQAAGAKLPQIVDLPRQLRKRELKKLMEVMFSSDRQQPASLVDLDKLAPGLGILREWHVAVQPLHRAYDEAVKVAGKRSSHRVAYEGAFTTLYNIELAWAEATGVASPKDFALAITKNKIGQPKPLADLRFQVEAFWTSIEIRLILAELTGAVISSLSDAHPLFPDLRLRLSESERLILKSAAEDAAMAVRIAEKTSSHRQLVKCETYVHRCRFAQFQFDFQMSCRTGLTSELRTQLTEEMDKLVEGFEAATQRARVRYLTNFTGDKGAAEQWLGEEYDTAIAEIAGFWDSIATSVKGGTFYTEVSLQEKAAIVKALRVGTPWGRFYLCPNGHPYVITECGGAMQQAQCPECGAAIGGGDHRLRSDNTRATELDNLIGGAPEF
ncbi:hypothetical protein DL93DRAFT_2193459 [Clavulina sp. PMI_390]|nr:hypothetical protein DL93DRAFT_2193459 [Clavulina sp. PMI_390]